MPRPFRFLAVAGLTAAFTASPLLADDPPKPSANDSASVELPSPESATPERLFEVDQYSEGVVFDRAGSGFISHGPRITRFTVDGEHETWVTLKGPNGHKVRLDGTHVVCDPGQKAVVLLAQDGRQMKVLSDGCNGQPLRGPNDLTLDVATGGFYFTDPGGSDAEKPIGTVHYVDADGNTSLVAEGLAFPNGIVLTPDRKRLLVAESRRNRILEYPVLSPGKVGEMRVFTDLPAKGEGQVDNQPDGICLDAAGRLYVAHYGMGQVQVLDPQGQLLHSYPTGLLLTSNVAFGGPLFDTLYVTGRVAGAGTPGGVAVLKLKVPGQRLLSLGEQNR